MRELVLGNIESKLEESATSTAQEMLHDQLTGDSVG